MPIVMYDLAGADPALRFSPYCWRTRMALAHKGLGVETVPWRFTDKDMIAFSGQGRVPVIRDGETVVSDSWAIACYLEAHYPERPSLFGGAVGQAHARLINAWADAAVLGAAARLIVRDVFDAIDPKDREYFRSSREQRFGATLEAVQDGRAGEPPGGVPRQPDAGSAGATRAVLARWRGAELRRLHPVRHAAMAALHQPVRGAGAG